MTTTEDHCGNSLQPRVQLPMPRNVQVKYTIEKPLVSLIPSYCSKQITTSTNDFIQELEQLYALWILVFQT